MEQSSFEHFWELLMVEQFRMCYASFEAVLEMIVLGVWSTLGQKQSWEYEHSWCEAVLV